MRLARLLCLVLALACTNDVTGLVKKDPVSTPLRLRYAQTYGNDILAAVNWQPDTSSCHYGGLGVVSGYQVPGAPIVQRDTVIPVSPADVISYGWGLDWEETALREPGIVLAQLNLDDVAGTPALGAEVRVYLVRKDSVAGRVVCTLQKGMPTVETQVALAIAAQSKSVVTNPAYSFNEAEPKNGRIYSIYPFVVAVFPCGRSTSWFQFLSSGFGRFGANPLYPQSLAGSCGIS